MATFIYQTEEKFHIKLANHSQVIECIQSLQGKETNRDSINHHAHFSFVETKDLIEAKSISDIFKAWRWLVDFDDKGDIYTI